MEPRFSTQLVRSHITKFQRPLPLGHVTNHLWLSSFKKIQSFEPRKARPSTPLNATRVDRAKEHGRHLSCPSTFLRFDTISKETNLPKIAVAASQVTAVTLPFAPVLILFLAICIFLFLAGELACMLVAVWSDAIRSKNDLLKWEVLRFVFCHEPTSCLIVSVIKLADFQVMNSRCEVKRRFMVRLFCRFPTPRPPFFMA